MAGINNVGQDGLSVYNATSNQTQLVVQSGGNVGIGTTSPGVKLEVAGDASLVASNPLFKVDGSGHASIMIDRGSTSYDANLMFATGGSTNWRIWNDGSNDTLQIRDEANSANVMTWKTGGNVGIGTDSPSAKLHIQGTSSVGIKSIYATAVIESGDAQLDITSGPGGSWGSSLNFVEGNGAVNTDIWSIARTTSSNNSDLAFNFGTTNQHTNDTKVFFKSNGNVGIGTTSPVVSLDLSSKNDAVSLPVGDDAARPSTPVPGMIRYNTSASEFEGYSGVLNVSGSWGALGGGGGGASTITTDNFSGNGTVGPFTLTATPSGGSTSFVDVFIDGVYQEISTYTISGTALSFAVGAEPPTGTNIQTKTTSGAVSGALVSSVDIGQSSGNTGAVNLRIVPVEVTSGQTIPGNANSLYIFTATGAQSIATVTLPGSPTLGDSIKISNLGGLANVLGANGNKIMGQAADMTINTPTAAFELIWSGSNNGWIIIGNV